MNLKSMFRCSIFFFIILFNLIDSLCAQQIKFANTTDGLNSKVYGINGNSVFKIDSSGNSIWVKDFSGYIVSSIYPNQLFGIAFDGSFLYVVETQGIDPNAGSHTYYPAIIKMDTLGNVMFVKSGAMNPANSYYLRDVFPAIDNGVWIIDDSAPGFTHYGSAFRVDSVGDVLSNIPFWYGSVSITKKVINLSDSTYIMCVNHFPSTGGMGPAITALTKVDNAGNILWRFDYAIPGYGNFDQFFNMDLATDNSSNIYLMCFCQGDTISGTAGLKLDANGNILISKLWEDLGWNSVTSLKFKNNQLVCVANNEEIFFDTLFNSCLNEQHVNLVKGNNYVASSYNHVYTPTTFLPSNGQPFVYVFPAYPDHCANTAVNQIHEVKNIEIYPNPARDKIRIETGCKNFSNVIIRDLSGRVVLEREIPPYAEVDIGSLNKCVYFVTVINEIGEKSFKLFLVH